MRGLSWEFFRKQIVPYRSVYSEELETNVNVTTKNVFDQYIEENSDFLQKVKKKYMHFSI